MSFLPGGRIKSTATYIFISSLFTAALLFTVAGCEDSRGPTGSTFRGNPIEGELSGVLGFAGSPYLVVDTLTVPYGSELLIEPGVELRFEPEIPFEVYGNIIAVGSEAAPITFTSGLEYPKRGDWDGIWLYDADRNSRFEYCYFLFGAKYGRHYHYKSFGGQLDSSLWDYGTLTCIRSSPTIYRCWFLSGGFHGLHCDTSANPLVENSVFFNNAGHGIYVHPLADPEIYYNIIVENDDYGVFCWEEGNDARENLQLWYNIVWSNFSGEYSNLAPHFLGRIMQVNGNLDSCDRHFNLRLNPDFKDPEKTWDFRLNACSAAIDAGPDDPRCNDPDGTRLEFGIYPYQYRPGEIRRLMTVDRLETGLSPYYMSCNVLLPKGATLTIEPGVDVLVEGRYKFRVQGRLISDGTESSPVSIRSGAEVEPGFGDWIGIDFDVGGDEGSELRYTHIANARWGLAFNQREAVIDHCIIEKCDSVGILCYNLSDPLITDCIIRENHFAGIMCWYNSSPLIRRCTIGEGVGYGIYVLEHSMPVIINNLLAGSGTSGIRMENLSSGTVINNTIGLNGYYGINLDNNSSPEIRNNIFYKNGSELRGGNGIKAVKTSRPEIEYNCFWGHPRSAVDVSSNTELSESNILVDPAFVDPEEGDFHLSGSSPCLTKGDPDIDTQMGAYGGPEAGR